MKAIPRPAPLTVEEIAFFRALSKPAILLLLMLRLGRPATAKELAAILGKEDHTVLNYLNSLMAMKLVVYSGLRLGYSLVADQLSMVFFDINGDFSRADLATTTTTTINRIEKEIEAVVAEEEAPARGKNPHKTPEIPINEDLYAALLAAGVGEPKRSELAALPHVSAEAVKA
jgi:phage FluMu protein gp41